MAFINGTGGTDMLNGTSSDDYIAGRGGTDFLDGGHGADRLYGGDGHDVLYDLADGDAGDALFGEAGDDSFQVYDTEADTLDGGVGSDWYYVNGDMATVVDLVNQSANAGHAAGDRLRSIEQFRGGSGNDRFLGSNQNEGFQDADGDDFYNGRGGTDIYYAAMPIGPDDVDFEIAYGNRAIDLAAIKGITLSSPQSGVAFYEMWTDGNADSIRDLSEVTYQIDELVGVEHYLSPGMGAIMAGSAANEVFYCSNMPIRVDGGGGTNDFVAFGGIGFAGAMIIDLAAGFASDGAVMATLMRIESAMGSDSSDQITGNGLVNTLVGLTGDDLLDGRGANDRLDGGAGMDLLVGGDGNDVLMGGALGDTLDGGLGIDTACYADASNNLSITLATGAKGMDQGDGDTFVSIENVIGSRNGDAVHGNGVANRIEGREGGDRLMGGGGDDRLFGDFDPGSAVAPGVTSFDPTVTIGDQAEIEDESEYAESNYLYGQGGNDILVGGDEYDDLYGGAGNDQLDGGGGSNNLYGGAGNDIYIVGGSDDRVSERAGEGSDRVIASENHYLYDNLESLVLTGTAAIGSGNGLANSILGNTAANRLYGGDGEDRLNGGGGDDRLSGGDDADSLTGGTGRDRFRFDSGIDGTDNIDAIEDFVAADDTILLDRAIFDAIAADGRLAASAFRAGTEATDASDRIVYHQATGRIFYDADGSGGSAVAVLFATVDVGTILTSADFVAVSAPNLGQDG